VTRRNRQIARVHARSFTASRPVTVQADDVYRSVRALHGACIEEKREEARAAVTVEGKSNRLLNGPASGQSECDYGDVYGLVQLEECREQGEGCFEWNLCLRLVVTVLAARCAEISSCNARKGACISALRKWFLSYVAILYKAIRRCVCICTLKQSRIIYLPFRQNLSVMYFFLFGAM
jgi:hypothetical protein